MSNQIVKKWPRFRGLIVILVATLFLFTTSYADIVRLGPEYFPDPTKGIPVSSGSIFIGDPGTDPETVGNQIQVSALQENGSTIPISQPILTSSGGVPLYNGSPVTLLVDETYSLKVLDSSDSHVYYVPSTTVDVDTVEPIVEYVKDIIGLINTISPIDDQTHTALSFFEGLGNGGGSFYWDSTIDKATANGGTIVDPDTIGGFDGTSTTLPSFLAAQSTGIGFGCWVRIYEGSVDITWFGADPSLTDNSNSVALQKAFDNFKSVTAGLGDFTFTENVEWPSFPYNWELSGSKGDTSFISTGGITILSPPDGDLGQYGLIQGIKFDSDVNGTGTGIGKLPGASGNYIAHLTVKFCDFSPNLAFGIDAQLIECDINWNRFGFPISVTGVNFTPINGVGSFAAPEHSLNANRIKYNEFQGATGDYAVYLESGYLVTFDGNTFEQNETNIAVIGLKDFDTDHVIRNWFEANGPVPLLKLIQGTTLSTVVNVFSSNQCNQRDQGAPSVIDLTGITNKRVVMRDNLLTAALADEPYHILQDGATFDQFEWLIDFDNNFVVRPNALSPNSTNADWSKAGSGIIGGTVTAAKARSTYSSVQATIAVPVTIFSTTSTSGQMGMYLVMATIADGGATISTSATIIDDGATTTFADYTAKANLVLSITGANVQVTQGAGGTQTVYFSILRLN